MSSVIVLVFLNQGPHDKATKKVQQNNLTLINVFSPDCQFQWNNLQNGCAQTSPFNTHTFTTLLRAT